MKHLLSILTFFSLMSVASAKCISGDCINGFGTYIYEGRSPILMVANKLGFFLKINSFNQIRLIQLQKIVVQMHIKQQNFGNIMIHKKRMILEKK